MLEQEEEPWKLNKINKPGDRNKKQGQRQLIGTNFCLISKGKRKRLQKYQRKNNQTEMYSFEAKYFSMYFHFHYFQSKTYQKV